MKPAPFDYIRAESPEAVLAVLAEHGRAVRILSGGLSLLPMLNMRLATPEIILDASRLNRIAKLKDEGESVVVEAGITQAKLLAWDGLATHLPLFAKALPWVGHAQTRSRGTVCGSLAHADPSAEIPLCVAVQGGRIELATKRKIRTVSSEEFHVGMMMTDRHENELLSRIILPKARPGEGFGFREFGRRHGDFAIVACAAKIFGSSITFGVGGVADVPTLRSWDGLDGSTLDDALNEFAWSLGARADLHADARMRRDLVRKLGRQAIEEATHVAGGVV